MSLVLLVALWFGQHQHNPVGAGKIQGCFIHVVETGSVTGDLGGNSYKVGLSCDSKHPVKTDWRYFNVYKSYGSTIGPEAHEVDNLTIILESHSSYQYGNGPR